jgi:hypothetical protein
LGLASCKTDNARLNYLLPNEELYKRIYTDDSWWLIVKRSLNTKHQFTFDNQIIKIRTTNSKNWNLLNKSNFRDQNNQPEKNKNATWRSQKRKMQNPKKLYVHWLLLLKHQRVNNKSTIYQHIYTLRMDEEILKTEKKLIDITK